MDKNLFINLIKRFFCVWEQRYIDMHSSEVALITTRRIAPKFLISIKRTGFSLVPEFF